jgi:hypothetical protein
VGGAIATSARAGQKRQSAPRVVRHATMQKRMENALLTRLVPQDCRVRGEFMSGAAAQEQRGVSIGVSPQPIAVTLAREGGCSRVGGLSIRRLRRRKDRLALGRATWSGRRARSSRARSIGW